MTIIDFTPQDPTSRFKCVPDSIVEGFFCDLSNGVLTLCVYMKDEFVFEFFEVCEHLEVVSLRSEVYVALSSTGVALEMSVIAPPVDEYVRSTNLEPSHYNNLTQMARLKSLFASPSYSRALLLSPTNSVIPIMGRDGLRGFAPDGYEYEDVKFMEHQIMINLRKFRN